MSDTFAPIERAVLTPPQAASYLGLDYERDVARAIESLDRLVEQWRIAPIKVGRRKLYAKAELDRFIEDLQDEVDADRASKIDAAR